MASLGQRRPGESLRADAAEAPAGAAERLFNRNVALLFQGQVVSLAGSAVSQIAIAFWVLETTGSPALMGAVWAASALPGVLAAPVAGVLVDRASRRQIIVWCDVVAGVAMLSLAAVMVRGGALAVPWLIGVMALASVVGAFFRPAVTATLPDIVSRPRLDAANSLFGAAASLAQVVGQGAGGVLFRVLGAPLVILVDGVSFLLSAFSESFLRLPPVTRTGATAEQRPWADLREGLRYVWSHSGLRSFMLLFGAWNLLSAPIIVLLPILVRDVHGSTPDWFGYILAALGVGNLLGFAVVGGLRAQGRARLVWLTASVTTIAVGTGLLGLTPTSLAAVGLALVVGSAMAVLNVISRTTIQATTPRELLGRVSSLWIALQGMALPIGYLVGGLITESLSYAQVPFVLVGCGVALLALVASVTAAPSYRAFIVAEI